MHVLLPSDGTDLALETARRGLAVLTGATKVTLLSVVADLPVDTGGGIEGPIYTPEQAERLQDSEEAQATDALTGTEAVARTALPATATIAQRIETGDPAGSICKVASELSVDVIVIGSHGKGLFKRAVLGSVSEHVIRHAPCPVLVVHLVPHED